MLGDTKKSASIRKSAKLPKLNIQQQIENQQIADRMNRKIAFTKNPRHLMQTLSYAEAFATTENGQSKFRVEPEQLYFSDYDTTHVYESQIKLINNSKYIQRIKVTPLKQKEFVIASIKYPKQDCGDIAPGMSAIISVRFRPNSLNDFQDQLLIITGDGSLRVPIIAQRQRCNISWPKNIECGHCWVGDVIKKQIVLKNRGGEATFVLLGSDQNLQHFKIGNFKVTPTSIKFQKNTQQKITVQFAPQVRGAFKQKIRFKSYEGDQQQVEILLQGGAYSAQIILEQLNSQKMLEQKINNILYINNSQLGKQSKTNLKIRNLAVVQVDYFWHFQAENIVIDKKKGKMKPSQLLEFNISFISKQKIPETVRLELYLYNLPEKSLSGNVVTKNINGIDAILCLNVDLKTKPIFSQIQLFPLHRKIVQPLYENYPVRQWVKVINNSSVPRNFKIQKITEDQGLQTKCQINQGTLQPKTQKQIFITFNLIQLTQKDKKAFYLISFDNSKSQMFSLQGKSTYPKLLYRQQQLYYGLCKTYTLNKKKVYLKNTQKTPITFNIVNNHRFYVLDFYDFYQFEDELSYKKKFNIYNSINGMEVIQSLTIPAQTQISLDCYLNTLGEESIEIDVEFQVKHGPRTKVKITAQVQDVEMSMNRTTINMRQIYKGNLYNSNKFLSRQLQIINQSNHDCGFQIIPPDFDHCQLKIEPLKGIIKKNSHQRIDLLIEPIKTGQFSANILWKYFDDFKVNSQKYPEIAQNIRFSNQDGKKSLIKQKNLVISGTIKGMAVNYYIKDEARVKKVKVKLEDGPQSIKMSSSSFHTSSMKSSKNLHQNQKLVYPTLEELNFYNCEINQVRQIEIIIQNDSGLTTQYQIYAEQFHTLQKQSQLQKKTHKGLVKVQQQQFSSEMGKTFIKSKVLDRSQKVHLGNNKGISILCEPPSGTLHKKQNQKILITMFNDTSGRFKDSLVICVKNHETKKIPINIHIKGTPVSLSKNQLGIDFNQQIPFMNLGAILNSNGLVKKSIKVVNNGPKQVELNWLVYPYNKVDKDKDIFKLELNDAPPGSQDIVQVKWNALKPQIDKNSSFTIEPKQKKLKGRQEFTFTVFIQEIKAIGSFSNLLICEPCLVDGPKRIQMESLAVVIETETTEPRLTMDVKHKNHINKFQKFAIPHEQYQTNSNNSVRVLKLKNTLKANLTFQISINNKDDKFQYFKLIETKTNSPATTFTATKKQIQTSFVITSGSILQASIQLNANPSNANEWPLQAKIRKDAQLLFSYSNGQQQIIDLVGWLYRPWVQIQMPNYQMFSIQNFEVDFGTVHIKNSKKQSFYLINPSKTDGKFTISYIKYHQSIKYKFEQSLWTKLDYEDQSIQDEKKCWKLSLDSGTVRNNTIPVHYMPATLALPGQDDNYSETHKPIQVMVMFKPEANVLYKSKFRVSVAEGPTFDIVVKGRGTYQEELQKK